MCFLRESTKHQVRVKRKIFLAANCSTFVPSWCLLVSEQETFYILCWYKNTDKRSWWSFLSSSLPLWRLQTKNITTTTTRPHR